MVGLVNRQSGFTLVEILIAFVIAVLVAGVVFPALTNAIRSSSRAEANTRAVLWAESKLETIGRSEPLLEGEQMGEFGDGLHWRLLVRRHPRPERSENSVEAVVAYDVVVTVFSPNSHGWAPVELVTIRLAAARLQ